MIPNTVELQVKGLYAVAGNVIANRQPDIYFWCGYRFDWLLHFRLSDWRAGLRDNFKGWLRFDTTSE